MTVSPYGVWHYWLSLFVMASLGVYLGPWVLAQEGVVVGGSTPAPATAPATATPPAATALADLTNAVFSAPRYAVVMGINNYADDGINDLELCEKDAQAVYNLLIDPAIGGVPKNNATLLLGEQATANGMRLALSPLGKIPARSVVFVYYSGHGMKEGDEAFWVTQDAVKENLAGTALSDTDVQRYLKLIPSDRVIVMIDACYAAATAKGNKAVDVSASLKKFTGKGRAILSAAGDGEEAIEAADLEHSVFTYYLLKGLRGAADANTDGVLVLPEITNYLDEQVADAARQRKGVQRPVVDLAGVQEPAKFSVVIDTPRLQAIATANEAAIVRRAARSKALRGLALDEVLTVEQFTEAKRLLAVDPAKLTELDRLLLAEYGRVLDGELPPAKLTKALELARMSSIPALLVAPFTPAEASAAQAAWAKSLQQKIIERTPSGIDMVLIPPGEFDMGNEDSLEELKRLFPEANQELFLNAVQRHRVRITQPFRLGQHEVTIGQFRKFVAATSYQTEAETDGKGGWGYDGKDFKQDPQFSWRETGVTPTPTDDHPVVNVSWNDVQQFLNWLNRNPQLGEYRLPTEAQWEYACRAGTITRFQSGDDPETLAGVGNISDGTAKAKFSHWPGISARDGYVFTAPVGTYRANAFGLHDLHGNVWEWCQDWSGEYDAGAAVTIDPSGPAQGSYRVCRGGGWGSVAFGCRSASRFGDSPVNRDFFSGFRVALVPASK